MGKIKKVVKVSFYDMKNNGKYCFFYSVYYPNKSKWRKDRRYTYNYMQSLPITVVNFLMDEKTKCTTEYIPENEKYGKRGYKIETHTM